MEQVGKKPRIQPWGTHGIYCYNRDQTQSFREDDVITDQKKKKEDFRRKGQIRLRGQIRSGLKTVNWMFGMEVICVLCENSFTEIFKGNWNHGWFYS